jgi:competence protein ComEA
MFSQVPAKEKVKYGLGFCATIAAMIFAGLSCQKAPPSKITFEDLGPLEAKKELPPEPSLIVVHVTGAVKKPGVYKLKGDVRIDDALRSAGGAKTDADMDVVNLAAKVNDGVRIHFPSKKAREEIKSPKKQPMPHVMEGSLPLIREMPEGIISESNHPPKVQTRAGAPRSRSNKKGELAEKSIVLNAASEEELQKLPGIGPATARKIVVYRYEQNGFISIEELAAVPGVGQKKFDAIKKYLRL